MRVVCAIVLVASLAAVTPFADGELANFHNRESWEAAVGQFTTIGFTGLAAGTFVTNQYSGAGALFSDGNDTVHVSGSMVNDGAGLSGNETIEVTFSQPMTYLAIDFPGDAIIDFFDGDDYIDTSDWFGLGGTGNFGGVLSDESFDRIVISDPVLGGVFIDDLHFGTPIPAPAVATILALGALWQSRRRGRARS